MSRQTNTADDRDEAHWDTTQEQGVCFVTDHDEEDSRVDDVAKDGEERENGEHDHR